MVAKWGSPSGEGRGAGVHDAARDGHLEVRLAHGAPLGGVALKAPEEVRACDLEGAPVMAVTLQR